MLIMRLVPVRRFSSQTVEYTDQSIPVIRINTATGATNRVVWTHHRTITGYEEQSQ